MNNTETLNQRLDGTIILPGNHGYDPVAFFTDGKPVKGKPEFPARHNGALYYFRGDALLQCSHVGR